MILPLLAQWILLSNHNHTEASHDSSLRVADLDRLARSRGVQAVVVTDHNTVKGVLDPAFHASSSVTFIEGQEWGSWRASRFWGHVGLIGLRGDVDVDPRLDLDAMFAQARERGALTVVNHPFNWVLYWRGERVPDGASGIEVWNQSWGMFGMDNPRSLIWWDAALREGRRLVAVGGTDVHGVTSMVGDPLAIQRIDSPVNLVWAEDTSTGGIMAGLRAGRVVVARDPGAARVELWAELPGRTAAMIGEEVVAHGPVPVRVRVSGGQGLVLSLHTRAGKVFEARVGSADATLTPSVEVARGRDFVRAELREAAGFPEPGMVALTNPVYFLE